MRSPFSVAASRYGLPKCGRKDMRRRRRRLDISQPVALAFTRGPAAPDAGISDPNRTAFSLLNARSALARAVSAGCAMPRNFTENATFSEAAAADAASAPAAGRSRWSRTDSELQFEPDLQVQRG